MGNKIVHETITMPAIASKCTAERESAMVFTNIANGRIGIPWHSISTDDFTLENAMCVALLDGYNHGAPAVYIGINDDNDAVYTIYKKIP